MFQTATIASNSLDSSEDEEDDFKDDFRVPRVREEKKLFLVFPEQVDMTGVDVIDSEMQQQEVEAKTEEQVVEDAAAK